MRMKNINIAKILGYEKKNRNGCKMSKEPRYDNVSKYFSDDIKGKFWRNRKIFGEIEKFGKILDETKKKVKIFVNI